MQANLTGASDAVLLLPFRSAFSVSRSGRHFDESSLLRSRHAGSAFPLLTGDEKAAHQCPHDLTNVLSGPANPDLE